MSGFKSVSAGKHIRINDSFINVPTELVCVGLVWSL